MNILITDKMASEAIDFLKKANHNVKYEELNQEELINEINDSLDLAIKSYEEGALMIEQLEDIKQILAKYKRGERSD